MNNHSHVHFRTGNMLHKEEALGRGIPTVAAVTARTHAATVVVEDGWGVTWGVLFTRLGDLGWVVDTTWREGAGGVGSDDGSYTPLEAPESVVNLALAVLEREHPTDEESDCWESVSDEEGQDE